uniref:RING-type E3 ubiquitin transferase n=1 Tax=Kalanchoe fedtschenkoi TaxID=63787 RepID=A0A7N0UIQ9_KALFE
MGEEDLWGSRDAERYVSEFRAYLGDRQKNRSGMELVKYVKKGGLVLGDGTCSVCLDEFEDEADVLRTACAHYFHDKCISVWLMRKASCPICRSHMQT